MGDINLLKEMKRIKGDKKQHAACPDNIDAAHGVQEVSELFKSVYEDLYNSAESVEEMQSIKEKLKALISPESMVEVNKVTGAAVKEACCRMKPGKSDVTGSFTSDVLLNGPDSLFESLAGIFRSFLVHGDVTLELLSCAFLPLFKGGLKNPHLSDSYRAIAGSSQILKLFDYVILLLWGDLLGSDTLQFGFKGGTSTTQCSWLVMEVASYYLRQGTPVIATLLDCSKAFDKCVFSALFSKLMDRGMPPIVVRALICVYEEQKGCVTWSGTRSTSFSITNGTRQGSVLSPTLFSVYLDDLLKELRHTGLGCHMGGVWVGAAGYADDLILLAPSRTAMKKMLSVCESYAEEFNLQFSTDPLPSKSKTKCLYFCGHMDPVYPAPLQLCGRDLPWVEHATHLGHELHQMCNMEYDTKVKRAQFVENSVKLQESFGFALPHKVLQAIQTCWPLVWFNALGSVWGEGGQIFRSWSTCVKETRCARATTGKNIMNIVRDTGEDPMLVQPAQVTEAVQRAVVPSTEGWRWQYLGKLLLARRQMEEKCENVDEITLLIDSLCSS